MNNHLIIFDCDGVLVDSEPLSNRIIAQQMCELGINMTTEEAIHLFAGSSLQNVINHVNKITGKPAPDTMEAEYRRRSYALFQKELQAVPGIRKALEELPFQKCVASNGPLPKMNLNLTITELLAFFNQKLYSAYEVGHWKPDPRLFLHAAQDMGYRPDQCIVIEDSAHGIHAARAAGMKVLGYAGRTEREKLERAGAVIFKDMNRLLVNIEAIL